VVVERADALRVVAVEVTDGFDLVHAGDATANL
jgi:hypothetical protein